MQPRRDAWLAIRDRRRGCDRQLRIQNRSDSVGETCRIRLREIGEHYDREVVAEEAREVCLEPLPRAAMRMQRMPAALIDRPTETVGVRLSAIETDRRENLLPALRLEQRALANGRFPRDEIADREVQRPVRRG